MPVRVRVHKVTIVVTETVAKTTLMAHNLLNGQHVPTEPILEQGFPTETI